MALLYKHTVFFLRWTVVAMVLVMAHTLHAATPIPGQHRPAAPATRASDLKKDGIHDPASPAIGVLQEPRVAFKPLIKSDSGNHVDWVKSLSKGIIRPVYDFKDASKKPMPMTIAVVLEVKGNMPDVVFRHQTHVVWLDCTSCHPAIFTPRKGADTITMAQIKAGKQCGVCHGTVAFPVNDCQRCHSRSKTAKGNKIKQSSGR